jgi:hypothetical protein
MPVRNHMRWITILYQEIARKAAAGDWSERRTKAVLERMLLQRNPNLSERSLAKAIDEGWQVARPEVRDHVDAIDRHVASVGYGVTGRFHHPYISACRQVRDHGIEALQDWRP